MHSLAMHLAPSLVLVKTLGPLSRRALGLRILTAASSTAAKAPTSLFTKLLHSSSSSSSSSSSRDSSVDNNGDELEKRNNTCVVSAALDFLENKKRIVEDLSPAEYIAVDIAIGASVGSHIRHSLDHFAKCLDALNNSSSHGDNYKAEIVRYDHRVRGGTVETDPSEAVKLISRLLGKLNALPRGSAGSEKLRSIVVSPAFFLGRGGASSDGHQEHEFLSNLERELFFCCHHGTHHDAMIRLILERMAEGGGGGARALIGGGKGLGVAPSTVGFRRQQQGGLDD